jgi:hypothetical protein
MSDRLTVRGFALLWDDVCELEAGYFEQIAPCAFLEPLDLVHLNVAHNRSLRFASTYGKTLKVWQTRDGVMFEAIAGPSRAWSGLINAIRGTGRASWGGLRPTPSSTRAAISGWSRLIRAPQSARISAWARSPGGSTVGSWGAGTGELAGRRQEPAMQLPSVNIPRSPMGRSWPFPIPLTRRAPGRIVVVPRL